MNRVLEPYCLCQCRQAKETAEHDRILRQEKELNAHHVLSRADSLMLRSTFKEDKYPDSSMSKIAHDYVNRWEIFYRRNNIGLFIFGNVGVGKTFYASCIANDIAKVYGSTVKALYLKYYRYAPKGIRHARYKHYTKTIRKGDQNHVKLFRRKEYTGCPGRGTQADL